MSEQRRVLRLFLMAIGVVAAATVAAALVYLVRSRDPGLPASGSAAYEETTTRFHRGLAELEVGLLDGALEQFGEATVLAPGEPAAWANLGLAHLRLGAFDEAAPAIERAESLAPDNGAIVFLRGRLESMRGRRDEGIAHLRRAVDLLPDDARVRTTLVQEIESAGGAEADAEAQRLLEDLLSQHPRNVAVIVERARLAAKRGDAALLRDSMSRLDPMVPAWPAEVIEQYRVVQQATASTDTTDAARELAFLRNVLAQVPEFLADRREVTPSAELIADPLVRFVRLPEPSTAPAAPDDALSFEPASMQDAVDETWQLLVAASLDGEQPPVVFAANGRTIHRLGTTVSFPFPGAGNEPAPGAGLVVLDWNHDFRLDLVAAGAGGVRLFLQGEDGAFVDDTARASARAAGLAIRATGAWAADVDMDGDLDLVVGQRDQDPVVLQNDGAGAWLPAGPFAGVPSARAFVWTDVDDDGDPDAAFIDGSGAVRVFDNLQGGRFAASDTQPAVANVVALAVGDIDADARFELLTMDASGLLRRMSKAGAAWEVRELTRWQEVNSSPARLVIADLDNNGAVDVLASAGDATAVWLAGTDLALTPLASRVDGGIWSVADLDGNGQLDLAGLRDGASLRFLGRSTRAYHYQDLRPRAQLAAGDQRINTFGVGGTVELRAGLLVQKHLMSGPSIHVGLGERTRVDVVRILWPNGVAQADFDLEADRPIVAEQRLKGSCPWIFADNGSGLAFVTDFLWRSPLGLKINAQATAGVTQTEDWVKIRGDQLAPRDGAYDVRISAELWETHFVDHVSLMVVDHPADVEVMVDERFVPGAGPSLAVHAMRAPVAVARAVDDAGTDVTDVVARNDGRYLATFARGRYQGVAEEHTVEVDLGAPIPSTGVTWLVAHGWIYPTDSSINVAIGQGGRIEPKSLSLEALDAEGRWVVVARDLGFPAGKNKTVLIDLASVAKAGVAGAQRLRLRTNLEIYWDSIATAEGVPGAPVRTRRIGPSTAELRYRGFSRTRTTRRDEPETPVYERIANTAPRWRDLVGYYTRFGDVRELLSGVEDRYVIMNAGDELRLRFAAPDPPASGWTRDFVLIGDGWVKDGDYNTSFSKTVLPLPAHATPDYESASPGEPVLARDPVYLRHREDWETFHTRFVEPRAFIAGFGRKE